jgi:glucokinase
LFFIIIQEPEMYKYATAIGADIGRYSLRIAVLNIDGEVLSEDSFPFDQEPGKDYLLSRLKESIKQIRLKVASEGINPICIGVAARGFVDHQTGTVLGPEHGVSGWKDVPLSKILNRETGLPVFVGNDANLMTIAEQKYGAAKGFKNVIFISLRSGIGGGIIIDGKLYRGANNAGGEIGQMIINYTGGISDLGIRGSLEYYASSTALIRRYYEEKGKSEETTGISAKEIFEKSYTGNKAALKVVTENAKLIGVGLANLISIFAPEIIVIGGGMAQAADSYINMIRESAFENSLENCRSDVRLERAHLGTRAAIMGAAYYSLTRLAGKSF